MAPWPADRLAADMARLLAAWLGQDLAAGLDHKTDKGEAYGIAI